MPKENNMQTPAPTQPTAANAIQGEEPRIAYGFITFPMAFNDTAHSILQDALAAGVRAALIEPEVWTGYFTENFSVGFFNVSQPVVGKAVDALEFAFKSLRTPGVYTIASLSAEDIYVPIRGFTRLDFARMFIRKDIVNRALSEMIDRHANYSFAVNWLKEQIEKLENAPPPEPPASSATLLP